jgi:hypothetical protein
VDIKGSLEEIVEMASTWIAEFGEVLAIARYSRAAGNRDYCLFSDPEDFGRWAFSLPPDCSLLVMKDYELNLRGIAGEVANEVPIETDVEWLVVVAGVGYRGEDWPYSCWGTAEVHEVLADHGGENVVVGRMPDWAPDVPSDAPPTLCIYIPRSDGSTHVGVY